MTHSPSPAEPEVATDDEKDGLLPPLNVAEILLIGLISPIPLLWLLTAPFSLALLLLGHPWLALASLVTNVVADTVSQTLYQGWNRDCATDSRPDVERRIGATLLCRATAAIIWPVLAVSTHGDAADMAFLGLMACLLISVAMAQGGLSQRLFWASASPVLAGLAVAIVLRFPLTEAAALIGALGMLILMLAIMGGGITRLLGDWSEMRGRNNGLIERLKTERNDAEAAREEARRASRVTSSFLATMSHEIRTPMNGVLGMAQLLKTSARGKQREQIDTLINSGEFLMSILNDILDISRIEAGRMDIISSPVALDDLARELTGFWRPAAEQKGLTFDLALDTDDIAAVMIDGRRIRQVLFNLIGNALKFTPRGGITVRIIAAPETADMARVTFEVIDTGIGIAADALPRLFDPFVQAEESSVRMFGGTGLGLAISRQLCELMDGRIGAESRPGAGSTFRVELRLPRAASQTTEAADGAADDVEPDAGTTSLSVLVVDDNPVNLMVMGQILTALGHQPVTADSGAFALEVAADTPFDMILMDIQMPGMTGIEALERLQGADGPNRRTPVLAVTADVLTRADGDYRTLGFAGHVSKPVQIGLLVAAMAEAGSETAASDKPESTAPTRLAVNA